jgi:hypothetical protein
MAKMKSKSLNAISRQSDLSLREQDFISNFISLATRTGMDAAYLQDFFAH